MLRTFIKKGDFTDVQTAYALNKDAVEKTKSIDEELTKVMDRMLVIQQKISAY
jgi:hypothetical protein